LLPARAPLLRVAALLRRHQHARRPGDAARGRARHPPRHHDQHLHARRQPEPARLRRGDDPHQQGPRAVHAPGPARRVPARRLPGEEAQAGLAAADDRTRHAGVADGRSGKKTVRAMAAEAERRPSGRSSGLMAQYLRIKAQHQAAILLFRLGDFYEMFFEDAETAARVLDLTLTARNRGDPDEVPLCGFPAHAAQPYVARLLASGHTVAICERLGPRELLLAPGLPDAVAAACRTDRPWATAALPEPVELEGAALPPLAARAAGGALAYVDAVYRRRPAHLRPPEPYALAGFLRLDGATRRNLELLETLAGERRGALLWVLDQTRTPMGARRLREWLLYPLLERAAIGRRLDAVEELVDAVELRAALGAGLAGIGDLER